MGLLDMLGSDEGLLGLQLMAAASPKARRTGFGEGLLGAMQGVQAQRAAEEDRKAKQQMQTMQMQEYQAQIAQRQAMAAEMQRKAQEAQRIQSLVQGAVRPPMSPSQAMSGGGGPSPENAAMVGQRPPIDFQSLIAQGVPPELVQKLAESANYGRQEVARTVETMEGGRPATVQFDKFGGRVGSALPQWKAPEKVDTGGQVQFLDPVSLARLGSLSKTMTPGESASNSLGLSNLDLSRERLTLDREGGGQLVETPDGYVRVGKDNRATAIMAPGLGIKPLMGKGANMTEDQAKASGWLVQAQNAYGNMQRAITSDPDAAKPGINDAIARFPLIGAPVANTMRGADRQKFMQGSASLSEALLRAATGAGINQFEAEQKIAEITPKFGDSDEVVAQKMAAVPLYLESLKLRAGPGAAKASAIGGNGGSAAPGSQPVLRFNPATGGFD